MIEATHIEAFLRGKGYATKEDVLQALADASMKGKVDPEIIAMALNYLVGLGILGHVKFEISTGVGDLYYVLVK